MKKIMKSIITVCLITFCFAACGSSSANNSTAAGSQTVSEEEKNIVDDKDNSQETSSEPGTIEEYFDERPDIMTPRSIDSSIELEHKDDQLYYYSIGRDAEKAAVISSAYEAYLKDNGYELEEVTDKIDSQGARAFLLKKNGNSDGCMLYANMEDVGLTISIGWY